MFIYLFLLNHSVKIDSFVFFQLFNFLYHPPQTAKKS